MRVCIAQPEHLPWLGYFDKMARSDVFVFLDTVQFKRRYFENRNRVRTSSGSTWVTVPVRAKGRYQQAIRDVEIDTDRAWQRPYWRTIEMNYRRAPYFPRYSAALEEIILGRSWTQLVDLNLALIRMGADAFGIGATCLNASALDVTGKATGLLVSICRRLGARTYLSGISGRDYLDEDVFRAAGIAVEYQEFHHPVYQQLHVPFEPCMGFVDVLFNHGGEARSILSGHEIERLPTVYS